MSYGFFPTDLLGVPEDLRDMLLESNISRRTLIALEQCIKEGYIHESDAERIAETHYLIWQGMLTMLINNRSSYNVDEATVMTMKHIRSTIISKNK